LPASISGAPVELGGKIHAINGVDKGELAYGVPRLVSLQGADQVPPDGQIGQRSLFLEGLLDPILADILEPSRNRRSDRFGAMGLGDPYDAHRVAPPARCLASGHRLAHKGQPIREAWEVHNPLIYRGMVGY
jgi:hypothetical protein